MLQLSFITTISLFCREKIFQVENLEILEMSENYFQTTEFRVGPMFIIKKLGDIGNIFETSLNCPLNTFKAFISLTICKRTALVF